MKHLRWRLLAALSAALLLEACAGSVSDPLAQSATLVPDTKAGVNLDNLPPPVQRLDVAVYNFPDLTGQNKPNDNFAEFSRATTQGGAAILVDALNEGRWRSVVQRRRTQRPSILASGAASHPEHQKRDRGHKGGEPASVALCRDSP